MKHLLPLILVVLFAMPMFHIAPQKKASTRSVKSGEHPLYRVEAQRHIRPMVCPGHPVCFGTKNVKQVKPRPRNR